MTVWSGIPSIIDFFGPTITYEGDNSVMAQQSFRYLKKMFKKVQEAPNEKADFNIFNYLMKFKNLNQSQCSLTTAEEFCQLSNVDETLIVCTAA